MFSCLESLLGHLKLSAVISGLVEICGVILFDQIQDVYRRASDST